MEEALTGWLLANADLTALVGDRIWWNERPQATALPAITLTLVSLTEVESDEGADTLADARVQIDCWAANRDGEAGASLAKRSARAVRAALPVEFSHRGIAFEGVFQDDARDFPAEAAAGDVRIHRRSLDLDIWHKS